MASVGRERHWGIEGRRIEVARHRLAPAGGQVEAGERGGPRRIEREHQERRVAGKPSKPEDCAADGIGTRVLRRPGEEAVANGAVGKCDLTAVGRPRKPPRVCWERERGRRATRFAVPAAPTTAGAEQGQLASGLDRRGTDVADSAPFAYGFG